MTSKASVPRFDAPYAADDGDLVRRFVAETRLASEAQERVDRRATRFIEAIRKHSGVIGGLEDFLREYSLSTREGLALMVLAEALLRVPDAATQDRLIEDKLRGGDWSDHAANAETWLVLASTWALGLSSQIVRPGETPDGIIRRTGPASRPAGGAHRDAAGDARPRPSFRARRDDRAGAAARARPRGARLSPFLRHARRGRAHPP